ncbi:PAS domain S-box protein [Methanoculleus taiwanensis]|uniref:PAS domain S-box protein n=1 Tax=Methanoculleus taiwanensis TaxID=1550565 RepID=UPI0013E8E997|nr:PAS domain S-box protein [Methanoculleus taiwanensis]
MVPQDIPAKAKRPVDERISELQAEIDALLQENNELRLADTEHKKDEEALRRENERVGAILSALDTGQSLVEPDMTIVWVNQKAREFFPEYEPIGQKCHRLFEGLSEPCEVCAARAAFSTGEVTRIEKFVPYRGRWFDIVAQPIKDGSGEVVRVLESFTDITERKHVEEALRESEAKYRTLVETALDIVLIHDGDRILYINPTGVTLLGAPSPDEILGRKVLEIVHPDFRDRVRENYTKDLRGEPSPAAQFQILRLDGTSFWVEGKGVRTSIAGTPVVQVIMRDITERKQAEDALRESQAALEKAQKMTHIGNWIWDLRTNRTVVSRELVRIYGVDTYGPEADNSVFQNSTHPDDRKMVEEAVRRAIAEQTKLSVDCRIIRPDGEVRFIHSEGEVVLDDAGHPIQFFGTDQDITERKHAEEALRESEEKYRNLVELAPEPIAVHRQGVLVYVNAPCVALFGGEKREDLVGKPILQFVHPDNHELVRERIRQVAETGATVPRIAEKFMKLDGQVVDVEVVATPITFENLPSIMVFFRDITERKHAEEALRHQAEMFQRLIDTIPAMVAIFDPKLQEFRFNRAFREILGWTEEDAAKGDFMALAYPDPEYRAEVSAFMRSLEPVWRDWKTTAKDGSIVESSWANIGLSDDTLIGIGVDIRERKRAEEAVRESRAKLEAALASMTDAVFISDAEGRFIEFNDAFSTFHRFGNKSECYRTLAEYPDYIDVYFADGTPTPLDMWAVPRALRGETGTNEVYILQRKDTGETWVGSYSFAPIRDKDGRIVGSVIVARDITEQKLAEDALVRHTEDLTRLHNDLEVANREANLYLDILTHDIGNTENVSNLYADLLIETLDGEAAGYMKKLQRSIQKSIEILGTVSTIRRIHRTTTELKPIDLEAAVRVVMEDYPASTFLYSGTDHQVEADDLLPVVFNNLIGNAVKFGGPDVTIAVAVEEDDGFVRVSVEDTGPGVPDDEKEEIFHLYEMKKRGVGEGLGLYLVQILVERYGGKVWVDDRVPGTPEKGAAFKFTLRKTT